MRFFQRGIKYSLKFLDGIEKETISYVSLNKKLSITQFCTPYHHHQRQPLSIHSWKQTFHRFFF